LPQAVSHGILPRMPRRSKKILMAREKEAQDQMLVLTEMTPINVPDQVLRQVDEETKRLESMSDEELQGTTAAQMDSLKLVSIGD
jgi:hypothetical protein